MRDNWPVFLTWTMIKLIYFDRGVVFFFLSFSLFFSHLCLGHGLMTNLWQIMYGITFELLWSFLLYLSLLIMNLEFHFERSRFRSLVSRFLCPLPLLSPFLTPPPILFFIFSFFFFICNILLFFTLFTFSFFLPF